MRSFHLAALAAVAAIGFASIASAADMPVKAQAYKAVPAPLAPSWGGFYIGANVGGGWMSGQEYTFADLGGAAFNTCGPCGAFYNPTALSGGRESGLLGGIHAGYNWHFAPAWLIGVEGDFTWTHLNQSVTGTLSSPGFPIVNSAGLNFETDVKWMASLRGRLGWIANPNWLVYATGGVAWANIDQSANATCPTGVGLCVFTTQLSGAPLSLNKTRTGFVVGGGAEWEFASQWRARLEYLYYGFDNSDSGSSQFLGTGGAPVACVSVPGNCNAQYTFGRLNIQTVRVGLSYAFR